MATVVAVRRFGNQLSVEYDDGTRMLMYDTGQDFWVASGQQTDNGDGSEVGDNGGPGDSSDDDSDTSTASLYNPWKNIAPSVGGTWNDHIARTGRGGTDYPLAYGTAIKAPADGTLHTSGGSGEYAAGYVGSAGRRSILYLDKTYSRKKPKGPNEATGPMRAIVFQHQSAMGDAKHYTRGQVIGYSGASANGSDYGGDTHLHIHGLDRGGSRVDYLKFF